MTFAEIITPSVFVWNHGDEVFVLAGSAVVAVDAVVVVDAVDAVVAVDGVVVVVTGLAINIVAVFIAAVMLLSLLLLRCGPNCGFFAFRSFVFVWCCFLDESNITLQ